MAIDPYKAHLHTEMVSAIANGNDRDNGGGIWHGNSEMSILNTTFANNIAERWVDRQSPMTIENSTFSGNKAGDLATQEGLGGGLVLNSNSTLINNTIANNVAGLLLAEFLLVKLNRPLI